MVGKGKGPSFLLKFTPASYFDRKTNETTIEFNEETESSTFKSLGDIGNPSVPYNPSISFHSAPTAGSYNITPVYPQNFHERYANIPYQNKYDPEEDERADSNIPYVMYYETIHVPAPHRNKNASGNEREQMLMSKQTGPSQNTRGKRKQAENAAENNNSRVELQKMITEGIKNSFSVIFTELEKRQADRISVQPSIPQSFHS
ncbi:hypothetical protein L1987_78447 [Smallanthus sonchifolius]|uniref:Uncharacterized protein n=1 Tax=Smallanthus sonchifolius TaxID=185202 RepID=A0ACB8ZCP0_9ASTR|nr:hypothetical protein L1987_78447 [Smallanthus sonchifolius]